METGRSIIVKEYLARLRETRKGKPTQVREALEVYIDLWEDAVKNGTVSEGDPIEVALSKVDKAGGLYQAAGQPVNT